MGAPVQQAIQPQGQAFTSSVGYQQQYASPSYQPQAQGYIQGYSQTYVEPAQSYQVITQQPQGSVYGEPVSSYQDYSTQGAVGPEYPQGQAYTGPHEYQQQYAPQSYQGQPQAYAQASNYGEVNQVQQPYSQPATFTATEESVPVAAVNQAQGY